MTIVSKYFTKKGVHNVKFCTKAGGAAPGAKVASLASKQVPMKAYCDEFNKESALFLEAQKKRLIEALSPNVSISPEKFAEAELGIKVRIYDAKNWEIRLRNTSSANLIKFAISLEKGAATPGKVTVSSIKKSMLLCIAKFKLPEMNARTIESALKTMTATASSMGVVVENDI